MVNWDMRKVDQSMTGAAAEPKRRSESVTLPIDRAHIEWRMLVPNTAAAKRKFGSRRNGSSGRDRDAGRTSCRNRAAYGSRSPGSIQQTPAWGMGEILHAEKTSEDGCVRRVSAALDIPRTCGRSRSDQTPDSAHVA